jgi:hypothetical protein
VIHTLGTALWILNVVLASIYGVRMCVIGFVANEEERLRMPEPPPVRHQHGFSVLGSSPPEG